MCEYDKGSDVYKEALKLVEWLEGDEVNGSN